MEGSDPSQPPPRRAWPPAPEALLGIACAAAAVALLAAKFVLAARINVNWDEFFFLSNVYALARGELDIFMQGAYTHAFAWITASGADEVDQVVLLRRLMAVLLVISALLLYALARLWTSRTAALVAVLAFLSTWPVIKHGASFRADSLLLPLTLAGFLFTLRAGGIGWRNAVVAGACLGLAFVVTVKAVLLLPALAGMALFPDATRSPLAPLARIRALLPAAVAAALVAVGLLAWHHTQLTVATEPAGSFASSRLQSAILNMPFAPRRDYLLALASRDWLYWLAMLAGLLVAVRQRYFGAAASTLALAPLLFYRNAYPYYFPVMLAPAAVLVAVAVDRLLATDSPRWRRPAFAAVAVAALAWMASAREHVLTLRFDAQANQRAIVSAVHRVFPQPVPYVDHSGMIASFPKVNFFMSGWGVEKYLQRGQAFMPAALAGRCPPLVLVDHPVLTPRTLLYRQLQAVDRRILEEQYVDYWGPIRVAGAVAILADDGPVTVRVPCNGSYRVEADGPILLDGRRAVAGDVVALESGRDHRLVAEAAPAPARRVRLVWAAARDAPVEPPPKAGLYDSL